MMKHTGLISAFGKRRSAQRGFTLIELAMVIIVIGILSAFAMASFGTGDETRDVRMVQSAQSSLQTIISQGSVRMDVSPAALVSNQSNAILNAIRATVADDGTNNQGVRFTATGGQFLMTIVRSGRTATYGVNNSGDVRLSRVTGFTRFGVDANGTISSL